MMHLRQMTWLIVDGQAVWLPAVAALGVVVGYVAGLFGIGGGFLLTPLLVVAFRLPVQVAVGTGLCQIMGTSVAALLRQRRQRQVEVRFDLLMLPGSIIGVWSGARLLGALSAAGRVRIGSGSLPIANLIVDLLYVALLVGAAALFFIQSRGGTVTGRGPGAEGRRFEPLEYVRSGPLARLRLGPAVDLPAVPLRSVSTVVVAYLGLGLGLLSGMLGIGGGIALMPVIVYGYGFPIRKAAGTGILALFTTTFIGTLVHALEGHVDLRLAMVLLIGATASAQLGARASRRLPALRMRRILSLLMLFTVAAVLWDLARRIG
jgi:uncharacterized membrane protein YfcA